MTDDTVLLGTIWRIIRELASCPWGPVTAHGVGILTEMHVIFMSVGPTAASGEAVTDARKARKYIRIAVLLL